MAMRAAWVLAAVAAAGPSLVAPAAPAQGSADTATVRGRDDTRAQRLFGEFMSPFCPGLTLATCPSEGADSLRWDIRERLDHGETPRQIRAAYVAAWGSRILGAPPLTSWSLGLWLSPAVLLVAGAGGVLVWLRSHGHEGGASGAAAADVLPADDVLRQQLADELKALDDRV